MNKECAFCDEPATRVCSDCNEPMCDGCSWDDPDLGDQIYELPKDCCNQCGMEYEDTDEL